MTNCAANVSRGHQFAIAEMGSASGAAFTRRLAFSRFGLRGVSNTVVDDGIADSLWDQEGNEQVATETVSGQCVINPRAADLQSICMCIFGGAAFSGNQKLPGPLCNYFQIGHADPFVNRVYRYNNAVTSQAVFSASDSAQLLNLAWTIEAQSRTLISDMTNIANWPVMALSTQQPFVFRNGVLTVGGTAYRMKQFSLTVDNQLQTSDFFNSLHRTEMPQSGQSFVLTHDSPWDLAAEADKIGAQQDVSAVLNFVSGTKQIQFEFPKLFTIMDEPEIAGRNRILNQYSWRAKHDPDNAIAAPVRITVVAA